MPMPASVMIAIQGTHTLCCQLGNLRSLCSCAEAAPVLPHLIATLRW